MAQLQRLASVLSSFAAVAVEPRLGAAYLGNFNIVATRWQARIRPGQLSLQFATGPLVLHATGPRMEAGWAVWRALDGTLSLALRRGRCSDGVSDRDYAYQAEVRFAGGRAEHGCAYRVGLTPR